MCLLAAKPRRARAAVAAGMRSAGGGARATCSADTSRPPLTTCSSGGSAWVGEWVFSTVRWLGVHARGPPPVATCSCGSAGASCTAGLGFASINLVMFPYPVPVTSFGFFAACATSKAERVQPVREGLLCARTHLSHVSQAGVAQGSQEGPKQPALGLEVGGSRRGALLIDGAKSPIADASET